MKFGFLLIAIENFKSIRAMEFNFDRPVGVHLIAGDNRVNRRLGSNGAGKSSIFDALCFVLYGKTPDGKRGPDLVPWSGAGTVKVSLLLHDHKSIVRTHAPNKLTYDGKVVDQEKLDTLLGMNFDTFCHTMLLGQSIPLFFDLTPTAKMQLFNDVLDLDRWTERSKKARKTADELLTRINTTETFLVGLNAQLSDAEHDLSTARSEANAWDAKQEVNRSEVEADLKQLNKRIELLQLKHDDNDLEYDGAMTEIPPLKKELRQLDDYLNGAIRKAESPNELKKQIEIARKGKCPTCGGPLRDDKHMKDLKSRLADARVTAKRITDLRGQISMQKAALEKFETRAANARHELDMVTKPLAEAKAARQQCDNKLREAADEINPYRDRLQTLRRRLKKIESEITENKRELKIVTRRQMRTEFWVKGFKDLELFLIDDVLQELEIATAMMLDQLGLIGWSIHYKTETETKAGTIKRGLTTFIKSPDNKEAVRWECWSGGEKQRLRILGALALSEVLLARAGIDPTIEILDEPSSHLSPEGVDDLCQFLADRARHLQRTIFYVDQTVVESSLFTSVVNVKRTSEKGTVAIQSRTMN